MTQIGEHNGTETGDLVAQARAAVPTLAARAEQTERELVSGRLSYASGCEDAPWDCWAYRSSMEIECATI